MTLTIPPQPLTGTALRAAWGEVMDDDLETAAARCGYVDESGCPDTQRFQDALLIHPKES